MSLDNFLNECKKNDRFTLIIAEPGGGQDLPYVKCSKILFR